jgi:hypothetical protein
VGKKGRMFLYLLAGGLLLLAGYAVVGLGAVVAISVVWIGLAVIYQGTPDARASLTGAGSSATSR